MTWLYCNIFIAYDRNPEERAKRRKLVQSLRKRRHEEPGRFHFISKGEICSREYHPETPQLRDEKGNTSSFAITDLFHSTLRKHEKILKEKLDQLGAATEQAVSITKSIVG